MAPFAYPATSGQRRHGPQGYRLADSYRPWLRDEFAIRCVFCLIREQWGRVTGEFDVEHFHPQAKNPELATEYGNLFYASRRCNSVKADGLVPDPQTSLTVDQVRILPDGSLEGEPAETPEARMLIAKLGLNSRQMNRWRLIWIRNVELERGNDKQQYIRLMKFPDALPDLSRMRPPRGNTRPVGIAESHFALRERGTLSETY